MKLMNTDATKVTVACQFVKTDEGWEQHMLFDGKHLEVISFDDSDSNDVLATKMLDALKRYRAKVRLNG